MSSGTGPVPSDPATGLAKLGRELAETAKEVVAPLPAPVRPVALCLVYLWGALAALFVLPVSLLLAPRAIGTVRATRRIRADAEALWADSGPDAAIRFLEGLLGELLPVKRGQVKLRAYGKVSAELATFEVADYLYACLCTLDDWAAALDLCRRMSDREAGTKSKRWRVRQARCLARTGRRGEALQALLVLRGRKGDNAEVEALIEELSRDPGPVG
jgi:hypothetical protein